VEKRGDAIVPERQAKPIKYFAILLLAPLLLPAANPRAQITSGEEELEKVRSVRIEGNSAIPDDEILKIMRTKKGKPFNEINFQRDLGDIIQLYTSRGYFHAEIVESRVTPVPGKKIPEYDILITVYEAEPCRVKSISVTGVESLPLPLVMDQVTLKPAEVFSLVQVEVTRRSIFELYLERGYIHAKIKPSFNLSRDKKLADVVFEISEGPMVKIGNINISGHRNVRKKIISRELTFKPGDPYNYKRIEETKTRLYSTRLFRDVRILPRNLTDSSAVVDLEVQVTETDYKWIGLSLGYGQTRKFQTELEWGHNNLFNNNQRL